MTKYEAHRKAHELWHLFTGTGGARAVGDRVAMTCIRRKNVLERFEVGYLEIVTAAPRETWRPVILGRGESWEEAFGRAENTTNAGIIAFERNLRPATEG